jgi:hypothetical protein
MVMTDFIGWATCVGLVSGLLNQYLGEFLVGVDAKQLSISVFAGLFGARCAACSLSATWSFRLNFFFVLLLAPMFDCAGEVNLENLAVKPSSLDFLHLPISVRVCEANLAFRLHL